MKSYDDDDDQEKLSLWSNTVFFGNMHGKTRFLKKDNIVADGMMVYESIYIYIDIFCWISEYVSTCVNHRWLSDYPQWLSHTQELRQRCLPLALNAHDVPDEAGQRPEITRDLFDLTSS